MQARPNIIYFLADQWRYDAVGCHGCSPCKTPNLDCVAREGTRFDRAYTTTALCSPARGTILTGLYPHHHGQLTNTGNFNGVFDRNILDCENYPTWLRKAGYRTGYAGKFHLPAEGNASVWGITDWIPEEKYTQWLEKQGIRFDFGINEVQPLEWGEDAPFCGPASLDAEHHHDYWVADQIIRLIEKENDDRPFMMCAGFHGPHFPYAVPVPYNEMYAPETVPRPINFDETFENKPLVQQKELNRWNVGHLTFRDWQKVIATYWGYCTFIDDQIGRVITALKEKGIYENTVILFTSDHGDMLGSHRLFNKGFNMYEEDHHIPCILRVPGMAQPSNYDGFVTLTDIMPTLLEIAGVELPPPTDGQSLLGFVRDKEPIPPREKILAEFNGYESTLLTMRMVRTKKWKYVYNPFAEDELYDEESDPAELHNLAPLPAFAHVLRRMRGVMYETLRDAGDSIVDMTLWQSNSYGLIVSPRER